MAVSIFNCWHCDKNLLGTMRKADNKYFFHCNKKCHDAYEAKMEETGRVNREWSAFMCDESPCPKEMQKEAQKRGFLGESNMLGMGHEPPLRASEKPVKAKKVGRPRKAKRSTEGLVKTPRRASKAANKTSKRGISKRIRQLGQSARTVKCGICGGLGHNARSCKKKKKR